MSSRWTSRSLGSVVRLTDPSGFAVAVTHVNDELPALGERAPHVFNVGTTLPRVNATQRPPRAPAPVQRLGHVVLQTPQFIRTLNWYLDTFGMIVSDFQYAPGRRDLGPVMAFIRCDRGSVPPTITPWRCCWARSPVTPIRPTRSPISTPSPPVANTCWRRATTARGHRSPHPGQPDLRLLGRSRQDLRRTLHRRRHVRQHRPAGLGATDRLQPRSVGARVPPEFMGAKPSLQLVRNMVFGLAATTSTPCRNWPRW